MKRKNLLLTVTFVLSFFVANAQNYENGDMILNFGLGIGNNYTSGGSEFSISIPPISASLEYIINDDLLGDGKAIIGVGAFAQYMNYNYEVERYYVNETVNVRSIFPKSAVASPSYYDYKYNKFILGPRGYFHYNFLEQLDSYTGLMMGLDYVAWSSGNSKYTHAAFIWSWFIGARYYFNETFAGMLELGYGATYVNLGIAYKFQK